MVGLRPDCMTFIAASLASHITQLSVLSPVGNNTSHIPKLGTRLCRNTAPAAKMSVSGVDDAVESCRLDNECIGHVMMVLPETSVHR